MGHTASTEPQCLYKGALYLLYVYVRNFVSERRTWIEFQEKTYSKFMGKERASDKWNTTEEIHDL